MARSDVSSPAEVLPERLRRVLFTVVEAYIQTAEPVASRLAAKSSGLELSPATVRALMAELTELGHLNQPHVSAGRVPTESAYRLYVDALLEAEPPADFAPEAAYRFAGGDGSATGLMQQAADLLARATGQVGFYLGHPVNQVVVEHIHFVRVSSERVMALLVSGTKVVRTRVFEEKDCDPRTLERVSAKLSEIVGGLTLAAARARLAAAIEVDRALSDQLQRKVFVLGWESLAYGDEAQLYLSDRVRLLEQPEFADVARLHELLCALEEKERMMHLLDQVLRAEISVAIGAELDDPGVRSCALVTAPLGAPPGIGGLGVIGPVRMRYDRVIPAVRYVSERVTDYLC